MVSGRAVTVLEGRVLLPDGKAREGRLLLEGGLVRAFHEGPAPSRWVLPGFIDVHVHGGGGHDAMDGEEGVRGLARFHAFHGTTALCPTTVTHREEALANAVRGVAAAVAQPRAGEARVLGTHLEGPFISTRKLGAQPPFARLPDRALVERLRALGPLAVVTLAPELEGALALVDELGRHGVRASLGHSDCDYATAHEAYVRGAKGATHLWNAMSGIHHRTPGLAVAALEAEGAFLELILDGHHVHPSLLLLARRAAKGRVVLVTDAIRAAGLPDGDTDLGGQTVRVANGKATLADGTLAGSVLTLDRALQNAVKAGVSVEDAAGLLARNPADYLGRRDLGRFEPGARADAVVLSDALEVEQVVVGGVGLEV